MLKTFDSVDGSALSTSKSSVNGGVMTTTIAVANAANSGKMEGRKPSEMDSLWCSYYRENCHTRENCWKLHGKPSNFFGKNNGNRGGNSCYKPQSCVADIEAKQLKNIAIREIFNNEEITRGF
ncbi:hypothetical protein CK203_096266 [Vitis vinifera]|uniref:Uncharacterized protein n=1 Tax=Vitis vinifera TaxID=29760 RepID=A0A438FCE7_VITVI|nr:hypothetical protein CK203_096266 [Vitis vinifera]